MLTPTRISTLTAITIIITIATHIHHPIRILQLTPTQQLILTSMEITTTLTMDPLHVPVKMILILTTHTTLMTMDTIIMDILITQPLTVGSLKRSPMKSLESLIPPHTLMTLLQTATMDTNMGLITLSKNALVASSHLATSLGGSLISSNGLLKSLED